MQIYSRDPKNHEISRMTIYINVNEQVKIYMQQFETALVDTNKIFESINNITIFYLINTNINFITLVFKYCKEIMDSIEDLDSDYKSFKNYFNLKPTIIL